jgi:hypothetical protein
MTGGGKGKVDRKPCISFLVELAHHQPSMSIPRRMVLKQIFKIGTRGSSLRRRRGKIDRTIRGQMRMSRGIILWFIDTMSRSTRGTRPRSSASISLRLRTQAREIRRRELHALVTPTASGGTPGSIIPRRKIA